jgi:hypothetical protein
MHTDTRLPTYAHWRGREFVIDLAENQPTPDIGSIIHLTVDLNGELQRLPFRVTNRRLRTDSDGAGGLLSRFGLGGGGLPTATDLDVVPHDPKR